MFDIVTMIQSHIDKQKIASVIFIDLEKAFDTVKRQILLNKLWENGIRGVSYQWFESYLSNRKQYIN